jgi:hypothetical protein
MLIIDLGVSGKGGLIAKKNRVSLNLENYVRIFMMSCFKYNLIGINTWSDEAAGLIRAS